MLDGLSEYDKGYLAALIDSEGSICCRWERRVAQDGEWGYPRLAVRCEMSSQRLVAWLHELFGGMFREDAGRSAHFRRTWAWEVSGARARDLCRALAPLLREKQRQATLAADWPVGEDGARIDNAGLSRRRAIAAAVGALNGSHYERKRQARRQTEVR